MTHRTPLSNAYELGGAVAAVPVADTSVLNPCFRALLPARAAERSARPQRHSGRFDLQRPLSVRPTPIPQAALQACSRDEQVYRATQDGSASRLRDLIGSKPDPSLLQYIDEARAQRLASPPSGDASPHRVTSSLHLIDDVSLERYNHCGWLGRAPHPHSPLQEGRTALHYAAEHGDAACLQVLLAAGSEKEAKDRVRRNEGTHFLVSSRKPPTA